MKLNPSHLIAITVIQREGSLSKAAQALNTSQPALSRIISELESRLGALIFDRSERPWNMTQLGDELAQLGRNIESSQDRAAQLIEAYKLGIGGQIRFAGPPFFVDTLVAPMIARFQNRYPDVRIEQSYGYPEELTTRVQSGDIDLAMCPLDPLKDTKGLGFISVMPVRNAIAVRQDHPLMSLKKTIQASQLAEYSWVAPPENSPLIVDLRTSLLAAGLQNIKISYSGAGLTGQVNHLKNSDCLAILPQSVVFEMRHDRSITALPFSLSAPVRSLGLMTRARRFVPPIVELLRDHFVAEFGVIQGLIERHEKTVLWGNSSRNL